MGISIVVEFSPLAVGLYLDPSSGGMILQILLGGVAGFAVIVRLSWVRLGSLFRWRRSDRTPEAGSTPDTDGMELEKHELD